VSPVKTPKSPKAGDYSDEFVEKIVSLRGREYKLRELDVSTYDELVQLATSKNDAGDEMVDNQLLRKLMTVKTCVSPRLPDGMAGMPMRLANKLTVVAQEVNYGVEPEDGAKDEKAPDIEEGEPEEEGEG